MPITVYEFLYSWIYKILIDEENINVRIIKGNQNAPRPKLPYIVIHDPPISSNKIGLGNWDGKVDIDGNMEYIIHFRSSIRIEEVGGNGNYLNLLLEYQNRQDIKDFWRDNNISLMSNESIVDVTDITENIIEKRVMMDIFILYTNTTIDENGNTIKKSYQPGFIQTAELEGIYTGKQN